LKDVSFVVYGSSSVATLIREPFSSVSSNFSWLDNLRVLRVDSRREFTILKLATMSISALGSMELLIMDRGALFATTKRPGRDANHSFSLQIMKIICVFINLVLRLEMCMSLWFGGLWAVDTALRCTGLHSSVMAFLFYFAAYVSCLRLVFKSEPSRRSATF
jgi:hypothetical protein